MSFMQEIQQITNQFNQKTDMQILIVLIKK